MNRMLDAAASRTDAGIADVTAASRTDVGIADIVYQQAEVNVEFQKDEVYFKRLMSVVDGAITELEHTYLDETKRPGGKYLNDVHQCMESTRMPVSNSIHPQTSSSSSRCRQTCNQKQPDDENQSEAEASDQSLPLLLTTCCV